MKKRNERTIGAAAETKTTNVAVKQSTSQTPNKKEAHASVDKASGSVGSAVTVDAAT